MSWPAITPIISRSAGAGVAEVEVARRAAARPPTPRPSTSQVAADLAHRAAQRLQRLGRVEHVLALEQAGDAVRPVASAPNISARCEIDLSPGTRTRPDSGRDLPADKRRGMGVRHGRAGLDLARPAALRRRCCAAIEQGAQACQQAARRAPGIGRAGCCAARSARRLLLTGRPARGNERPKSA